MNRVSVLARKISLAKWQERAGLNADEVPADAVGDLRTLGNGLSFWHCKDDTDSEIHKVVLALAAGLERVDKMDLVWVDESAVTDDKLDCVKSEGDTPVDSLRNRHVDIVNLDLVRLGKLAMLLAKGISKTQCRRINKKDVVEIIVSAVREQLVSLDDLKEGVRVEVVKVLSVLPPAA